MSLILDALRKMEQERKARLPGATDIRPEVLSYRGVQRKPGRPPLLLTVTAAVLILLAVGTGSWFLVKEEKTVPVRMPNNTSASGSVAPAPDQPALSAPHPQSTVEPATQPQTLSPPAVPMQIGLPPHEQRPAPVTEVSAASGITVSGIAYQDERSLRRAVINGSLVGEGSEVAGARVVEIKENRIRFSRAGEQFDLVYASGLSGH